MKVLIVADDLTGALDTAAPFVNSDMRVIAAVTPEYAEAALKAEPDVLAISTSSRNLPPTEAHDRVLGLAESMRMQAPALVFKKIDSRLKGNVVTEVAAMLSGLRLDRAILAPAIPDQGRLVLDRRVIGMGVDHAIPMPDFPDSLDIAYPDIANAADMLSVARQVIGTPGTLAVGARGLGQAIAICLHGGLVGFSSMRLRAPLLLAIGSRDPITLTQVQHLMDIGIPVINAPNGQVPEYTGPSGALLLVRCTQADAAESGDAVGRRFARGIARIIGRDRTGTLVACGGETAASILAECGVGALTLSGEVQAGLPISTAVLPDRREMLMITKSGGFGAEDSLVRLARNVTGST